MDNIVDFSKSHNMKAYNIKAKDIIVEERVYLKCAYGCKDFGKRLNCPPNCISIDKFKTILSEYDNAVILLQEYRTSSKENMIDAWEDARREAFRTMMEVEKFAFNSGFTFAHLLRPGSCNECQVCEEKCSKPSLRRFSPEAVGVNLDKTLKNVNIIIDYSDYSVINLIGILLLE
ncbi:DUF2284 domain-containing protein [Tepidibacter hydrothermalis]|uniref:DUF2284 domain-containing protein n=1 Tax=Tepidibacter hydrothermalis TaxID=3036126 RepID=A0ABY8EEQ8_9FIRM|nr:DUF2284 domain-containing protein [Tepidibacter hydrothermalis]WFD11438.1 DUF2284 domain-containing protein [Tepidibacter hydrothermalis]